MIVHDLHSFHANDSLDKPTDFPELPSGMGKWICICNNRFLSAIKEFHRRWGMRNRKERICIYIYMRARAHARRTRLSTCSM